MVGGIVPLQFNELIILEGLVFDWSSMLSHSGALALHRTNLMASASSDSAFLIWLSMKALATTGFAMPNPCYHFSPGFIFAPQLWLIYVMEPEI